MQAVCKSISVLKKSAVLPAARLRLTRLVLQLSRLLALLRTTNGASSFRNWRMKRLALSRSKCSQARNYSCLARLIVLSVYFLVPQLTKIVPLRPTLPSNSSWLAQISANTKIKSVFLWSSKNPPQQKKMTRKARRKLKQTTKKMMMMMMMNNSWMRNGKTNKSHLKDGILPPKNQKRHARSLKRKSSRSKSARLKSRRQDSLESIFLRKYSDHQSDSTKMPDNWQIVAEIKSILRTQSRWIYLMAISQMQTRLSSLTKLWTLSRLISRFRSILTRLTPFHRI